MTCVQKNIRDDDDDDDDDDTGESDDSSPASVADAWTGQGWHWQCWWAK